MEENGENRIVTVIGCNPFHHFEQLTEFLKSVHVKVLFVCKELDRSTVAYLFMLKFFGCIITLWAVYFKGEGSVAKPEYTPVGVKMVTLGPTLVRSGFVVECAFGRSGINTAAC